MNPKDSPMTQALDDTSATLSSALRDVKSTVGTASTEIKGIAASESARLGQQLLDWLHRNAEMAKGAAVSLREEASAVGDRTQRYVRDEPVKSVMLAAAAGAGLAVMCMLIGRRNVD